jgi:hypothetical protein
MKGDLNTQASRRAQFAVAACAQSNRRRVTANGGVVRSGCDWLQISKVNMSTTLSEVDRKVDGLNERST